MYRQGKAQGWLQPRPDELEAWLRINLVKLHEVKIDAVPGKGSALLASRDVTNTEHGAECLLTVPSSLILCAETIKQHAKIDTDFRELLESIGEFGQTARGAILTFLLYQISTAWEEKQVGVLSPFTFYVKTPPPEALSTDWSESELKLLAGTSLAPATTYKLRKLTQEYDELCERAASTRWWTKVGDDVEYSDWLVVDSMYRSRALDYPKIGHCMVPCLDIANHASGDMTKAVYDLDAEGNAILLLRNGQTLTAGEEVTISYGDEKGACEMIFSYGFIESGMTTAEALFLDLKPSPGDPSAYEKTQIAACAPGVKLIDAGDDQIDWTGDFIWLICMFEEDGLNFRQAQLVNGEVEPRAFWGDEELANGASSLREKLAASDKWDVWRLRALSMIQARVQQQLDRLVGSQDFVESILQENSRDVREERYDLAKKLRELEFSLLDLAYTDFQKQIEELSKSEVVVEYLTAHSTVEDDFT